MTDRTELRKLQDIIDKQADHILKLDKALEKIASKRKLDAVAAASMRAIAIDALEM